MATQVGSGPVITRVGVLRGARGLAPVALFSFPFGMAFGIAAAEHGFPTVQSVLMSALVFSGMAQFSALEFWRDPIAFGSLALVVAAVNARHVVMGAALSPWLNALPIGKRVLALLWLSDANFAVSQSALREGERDVGMLLGGGLALWGNWVLGTAVGALTGASIGDPAAFGIDVVMVCFLAAVVMEQVDGVDRAIPAAVAALVAAVSLDALPTGWNVIAGALAGGFAGVLRVAR